jgi:hypothetical protein
MTRGIPKDWRTQVARKAAEQPDRANPDSRPEPDEPQRKSRTAASQPEPALRAELLRLVADVQTALSKVRSRLDGDR